MSKKLDEKMDIVLEKIGSIDVTLAKQSVSLEEHIRRTNILEQKLEPVEKHVAMVSGVLKFIGLLAATAAIVEAVLLAVQHG